MHRVNSDGSCVGLGVVARDSQGTILFSAVKCISACLDVEISSLLAVQLGLNMALAFRLQDVVLETDSLSAIIWLQEQNFGASMYHELVGADMSHLSKQLSSVQFY